MSQTRRQRPMGATRDSCDTSEYFSGVSGGYSFPLLEGQSCLSGRTATETPILVQDVLCWQGPRLHESLNSCNTIVLSSSTMTLFNSISVICPTFVNWLATSVGICAVPRTSMSCGPALKLERGIAV